MGKAITWILGGMVVLVAVLIAALLIIPMFVDVQQYKPEIEKQISEATGRPFSIGNDLRLSLFPWAGLSFSNLRLGNTGGFEEKDFVTIKGFEVRVRLIPLLSREVRIKRFVVREPKVVLVRNRDGRGNWTFPEKKKKPGAQPAESPTPKGEKAKTPAGSSVPTGIPFNVLAVGEFSVTGGAILWHDHAGGVKKEITGISLQLENVSLDRPIGIALSAAVDSFPLALKGSLGPVGKDPLKGSIPLDLSIEGLDMVTIGLKGRIGNLLGGPEFDLEVDSNEFSPRRLVAALKIDMPVETADPGVLGRTRIRCSVKGSPEKVALSGGDWVLDDTRTRFSLTAADFGKPVLGFDIRLDRFDLDRYLPASETGAGREKGETAAGETPDGTGETSAGEGKPATPSDPAKKKGEPVGKAGQRIDYTPLRRLVLDGTAEIGRLKAKNLQMQDIVLKLAVKNGLLKVDPLTMALYRGSATLKAEVNVQKEIPETKMAFQADGIQANPLLKDLAGKDFLEGAARADFSISTTGDEPDRIKRTLNGRGDLVFKDGAIVGVDLADMVRNVKAAFGMAETAGEKPRTDFAELSIPFSLKNGRFKTTRTDLKSPLIRVMAAGTAHLVNETLDFRVSPKFVATIKGQGDTKNRSGIAVPVLVGGTFAEPTFRPDLEGLLRQTLQEGLPQVSDLKKTLPDADQLEGKKKSLEDAAKGLLKSLPFGQ